MADPAMPHSSSATPMQGGPQLFRPLAQLCRLLIWLGKHVSYSFDGRLRSAVYWKPPMNTLWNLGRMLL